MQAESELPVADLLALKDIGLSGKLACRRTEARLLADELIGRGEDGGLRLSAKGRGLLVRGSPLLWDI